MVAMIVTGQDGSKVAAIAKRWQQSQRDGSNCKEMAAIAKRWQQL